MKWIQLFVLSGAMLALSVAGFGQGYQVIIVNNGGTITGTVTWSGPVPHLASMTIFKDQQICDTESAKTRDLERLVVGSQGGVANTVVFLKNIASGKAMDLPEQRRFLDQKHCRYEPHVLLVPAAGTLQMKSSDAVLHTVHMDGAATYNLPFPFPNQVISRSMPSAGLVNLKCNGGHTWMNAEMLVVAHPYYAVTDEAGKFELSNVPPGKYEIVAWHEGWNVARREGSFDVLTEKRVQRPIFSEPRTWEKSVNVESNGSAVSNFVISEK
jgi:Polysaccharide lyase family 4, domain II